MATTSVRDIARRQTNRIYGHATGTVTIAGASGSIDSIEVDGVEVMSGVVNFATDSDTTATNVASNITAHTSAPDYNAAAVGSVITITPVLGGDAANSKAVVTTATTMTAVDVDMSGGDGTADGLSYVSNLPSYISVSGVAASNIVTVKGRVHPDDAWHILGTVDGDSIALDLITVNPPINFVLIDQTTGTSPFVAYEQLL